MRAFIFDIDGTLVDSVAADVELYFSAVKKVLGSVRLRANLIDYDHVTDSGILAQILEDNGIPADGPGATAVESEFIKSLEHHISTEGPFVAIDGAIEFVRNTRAADDTKVAIATGCWRRSALLKLASAQFDVEGLPLATCSETPSRIEIMRTALEGIDGDVDSVTYYGDGEWDERASQSLGWNFVAVGTDLGGITSYAGLEP